MSKEGGLMPNEKPIDKLKNIARCHRALNKCIEDFDGRLSNYFERREEKYCDAFFLHSSRRREEMEAILSQMESSHSAKEKRKLIDRVACLDKKLSEVQEQSHKEFLLRLKLEGDLKATQTLLSQSETEVKSLSGFQNTNHCNTLKQQINECASIKTLANELLEEIQKEKSIDFQRVIFFIKNILCEKPTLAKLLEESSPDLPTPSRRKVFCTELSAPRKEESLDRLIHYKRVIATLEHQNTALIRKMQLMKSQQCQSIIQRSELEDIFNDCVAVTRRFLYQKRFNSLQEQYPIHPKVKHRVSRQVASTMSK